MTIRCVSTGFDKRGRSVVVSDEMVEPQRPRPGIEYHEIWGSSTPRTVPNDGSRPASPGTHPPADGSLFAITVIPPEADPPDRGRASGGSSDAGRRRPGHSA